MTTDTLSMERSDVNQNRQPEKGTSLWKDAWYRLLKNKLAVGGGLFILFMILCAVFAPYITPYEYHAVFNGKELSPPSSEFIFGTDSSGRDLFTRVIYGLRISLMVGFIATSVSVFVGVFYGATSGFFAGKVDHWMMRVVEFLYSLPFMFLVILLLTIFGRNIYNLFFALGLIQWLTMARIVRGEVLALRNQEYVQAARVMGVSRFKILLRHIIPNTLGPVIIYSTLLIPLVILEEAFLSFLGLGVQEPMSSLGTLMNDGVENMEYFPWVLIFPALFLILTLLSLNFLGDGLRDALDPKASKD